MRPTNESQGLFPEQYLGFPTAFEADRERQFRKFDRVIQLSGFDEILATPESRTEYVDSLTLETFEQLITDINGIQVNLPTSHRKYADRFQMIIGEERIPLDVMPAPQHKQVLLESVLSYAQQAPDLEDKAFMLAMGITTVHPFSEGNGRLARSIYHLLTEGYTPNDPRLEEILGEDGEDIFNADGGVMRSVVMGNMKLEIGSHDFDPSLHAPVARLQVGIAGERFDAIKTMPEGVDYNLGVDVAGMLLQEDMKEMLPFLLIKSGESQAALDALFSGNNQQTEGFVFVIDKFWKNATNKDLELMSELAAQVKLTYVLRVLKQLSLGPDSAQAMVVDNSGEMVIEPLAVTMKRVFKCELDVSPSAIAKRKAQRQIPVNGSGTPDTGGLTRQERRKLEHKARRATRRSSQT